MGYDNSYDEWKDKDEIIDLSKGSEDSEDSEATTMNDFHSIKNLLSESRPV